MSDSFIREADDAPLIIKFIAGYLIDNRERFIAPPNGIINCWNQNLFFFILYAKLSTLFKFFVGLRIHQSGCCEHQNHQNKISHRFQIYYLITKDRKSVV